jgi:hypothetical protein
VAEPRPAQRRCVAGGGTHDISACCPLCTHSHINAAPAPSPARAAAPPLSLAAVTHPTHPRTQSRVARYRAAFHIRNRIEVVGAVEADNDLAGLPPEVLVALRLYRAAVRHLIFAGGSANVCASTGLGCVRGASGAL